MRLLSQRVELRPGWKIYSMHDTTLLPRSIADITNGSQHSFPLSLTVVFFFFLSPIILAATVGVGK